MFRHMTTALVALILTTLFVPPTSALQEAPVGPVTDTERPIDEATRKIVIDRLLDELLEGYVFPEIAEKMAAAIRSNSYEMYQGGREFALALTEDLQKVSRDLHLRVRYSEESNKPEPEGRPAPEEEDRVKTFMSRQNFGFQKIEVLEGNVGYLNLLGFFDAALGGQKAAAAMNVLADTDALIIDVRHNGGGDPAMVALISTYLFEGEPVHLNDLYWRPGNSTQQYWTLPHVPGQKFGGEKTVFVLTSRQTFSAAEEFAYNLKNLGRATIVGETTGGGAHPGMSVRIHQYFEVFVPIGRAINPISKTNWEGTGVKPDLPVAAEEALTTAHRDALEGLLRTAQESHEDGAYVKSLQDAIEGLDEE